MGYKSVILMFLLGFCMNGIVGPGVRVTHGTQDLPIEMAENDKSTGTEEKEAVDSSEQQETPSETDKPKATSRLKQSPPKDFVPSEKIPVDQAVDFPADI